MMLAGYVVGFILSAALTLAAYQLAIMGTASMTLYIALGVLAITQLGVQLIFFLHLGDEPKPRFKFASFLFMSGILLIVVVGSIWIMTNLDYNMMHMTENEKEMYMQTQYDKGF